MMMTSKQREALPKTEFAIPEERAYPIHDEEHARMALSMVSRYGTQDIQRRVRAAVKKKFPDIKQVDMKSMTQGKKQTP